MLKFRSYQDWKKSDKENKLLQEATELTSSMTEELPEEEGPDTRRILIIKGMTPVGICKSFESQKRIVELSDILFKIEGIQRLYRQATEEGPSELQEKMREVLDGLFSIGHLKLDQAKEAFYSSIENEIPPLGKSPKSDPAEDAIEKNPDPVTPGDPLSPTS